MYQIDNSTAAATQPASTPPGTPGFFTDGNPAGGVRATIVPAEWFNAVQQEVCTVITSAGGTLAKNKFNQLAVAIQSGLMGYAADTGAANVYTANYTPAIAAPTDGLVVWFKAKTANTGASTLNVNGTGAQPIVGGAHQPLQGGEIVANGRIEVIWNATIPAWVMTEQTGGALQVAPATQSGHAIQLGQATGRLLGLTTLTSSASFTPNPLTTTTKVRLSGGGGAGGGTQATGATTCSVGSGGGAGAYAEVVINGKITGTVTCTVGGGGTGVSGGTGGTGGATSFGTFVSCPGGLGGLASTPSTPPFFGVGNANSAAPTLSGATSILAYAGAIGGGALAFATGSLSGGRGNNNAMGIAAAPALGFGTGGNGAAAGNSSAANAGTAGTAGIIIVEEYA